MKPINLYIFSRLFNKTAEEVGKFEQQLSKREELKLPKEHEIETLKIFLLQIASRVNIGNLDGFFYGFTIPQIAKEFDLLKISESKVLNVELKSEYTSEEKIKHQLEQNKYYLGNLDLPICSYTFIADTRKVYSLNSMNDLVEVSIDNLISDILSFDSFYSDDIEKRFRVRDFLVSPINTPEKFISGNYFLTDQQKEFKKGILKRCEKAITDHTPFLCQIKGKPGTGKSLLLYDLAKEFSKNLRTCVIHCAQMTEEHKQFNKLNKSFQVIPIKSVYVGSLTNYNAIVVDETHRIYTKQFEYIVEDVKEKNKICIFGADEGQILSKSEQRRKIAEKLDALPCDETYSLSNKIRTNKELSDFITKLVDLNEPISTKRFENVNVFFANDLQEASYIINYLLENSYTFINYTPSQYRSHNIDLLPKFRTTHYVIGQEYDNVLMVLGDDFRYNETGKLEATEHPNPDYLFSKLFYQGITRAREKIAVLVIRNNTLFEKILDVVNKEI